MKIARVLSIVAAVLLTALLTAGSARLDPITAQAPDREVASISVATSPLLQYQGRLTDPSTGQAVADGSYSMTFRLYTLATGGTALWTETKDVAVQGGLFSTALGDTTTLSQSLFDGQQLWLGIKVGADDEATPRQPLLPVAYALSLVPGAAVQADSTSAALQVTNLGSGDALNVNGQTTLVGDLSVSGSLSGGSHGHSGGDITSGTVGEAYIDAAITRDSEVMSTVLANDGAASGLDADLLDGQQATAFASVGHGHNHGSLTGLENDDHTQYFNLSQGETVTGRPAFNGGTSGSSSPFTVDSDYVVTNLNADLLDGQQATAFAASGHTHSGADITSGTVAEPRIDAAIARDEEVGGAIDAHAGDPEAHHVRYTDGEAWNAVLANDGPDSGLHADFLDGYHASSFSLQGHDHDGSQITSGVVAEPHIDAAITRDSELEASMTLHQGDPEAHHPRYTDDEAWGAVLGRDGPGSTLNADLLDGYHSSAFAGTSHTHIGQSWSGSYSGGYGLSVQNTAAGDGIRGYSSSGNELDGGLYGYSYSTGSGVVGRSPSGDGVHGEGDTGVYGVSGADGGQGVHGHGTGLYTEGVLGTSDQAVGVYGIASASSGTYAIGVWGQTGADWGFYTGQKVWAVGGFVGPSQAYIAQSEDSQPLEVGDVVLISGIAAPLAGGQTPVLTVRRARTGEDGLLSVVQTRAVVDTAQALVPSADGLEQEEIEIAGSAPGRVGRGDYLFVVVQGLVQVRVDASTRAIEIGDPIGPSAGSGVARKVDMSVAPAPVLGHALEALPDGTGLVWVLILGH